MPYLVAAGSSQTKSYTVTDACDKPRIAVGGSYIPLTTSSGEGVKVSYEGSTYRLMDYHSTSSSQSASASYITTANSPYGLSNVTNLTRISTSNTIYLTRQSISGYGTRTGLGYETGSVMGIFRTAHRTSYAGATTAWYTNTEIHYTIFHNPPYSSQIKTSATKTVITLSISSYDLITYLTSIRKTKSDGLTSSSVVNTTSYRKSTNKYNYQFMNNGEYNLCTFNTNNCQFTYLGTVINGTYSVLLTTIGTSIASTTNTYTYTETTATFTRASTSGAVYETRVSTSGYSGVSSSSSSKSASTMTWA